VYDAIVLDVDGVLTRPLSLERRRRVVEGTFLSFGVEATAEEVDSVRHGDPDRVRRVCRFRGVDPAAFWQRLSADVAHDRRRALAAGRSSVYADVGAVRDLDTVVGVATSLPRPYAEHAADACGLSPAVVAAAPDRLAVVDRDPDRAPLDGALDRLAAEDVLYVCAGAAGVRMATRADVDSAILIRHDRGPVAPGATYELGTLREVPAVAETGSPLAVTAEGAPARSERP
jgi:phosphoglycolate phosphatase-like HAD superfamily hydrolase